MKPTVLHILTSLTLTLFTHIALAETAFTKFGVTLGLAGGSAPFSEACKNALVLATEDTEVIGPIAARAGVITMTLGAGGPLATRYSPNLFRATTSDAELAIASAKDLRSSGATKACVVTANTNYYQDITKEIVQGWESLGGVISYSVEIDYDSRDMASLVTRMKSRGCEAIFMWASPGSLAKLARELKNQKVTGSRVIPWFGDSPEVLQELKGDVEPTHLYRWVLADKSFSTRYAERFGAPPQRPAGNCYDGLKRVAAAVNKVGAQQESLARELLTAPATTGVTGPFTILPNRERTGETYERLLLRNGVAASQVGR